MVLVGPLVAYISPGMIQGEQRFPLEARLVTAANSCTAIASIQKLLGIEKHFRKLEFFRVA